MFTPIQTFPSRSFLQQFFNRDADVEATDDAWLYRAEAKEGTFWVDQLDPRFWSFHTDMPTEVAQRFLRERVEARRDLDWMWLPSEHLRQAWPGLPPRRVQTEFSGYGFLNDDPSSLKLLATGADSDQLLDLVGKDSRWRSAVSLAGVQMFAGDERTGWITEAVTRMGRFSAAGDSLELHLQFVRGVVSRYSDFVTLCEQRALGWNPLHLHGEPGYGAMLSGEAVLVKFSRSVPDLDRFMAELLAVRCPFRLWGVPQVRNGVAEVDAVDLHVGQRLRLDVGPDWMRVYLERGSCGNTAARLLANLQHRFDSALELVDPTPCRKCSNPRELLNSARSGLVLQRLPVELRQF